MGIRACKAIMPNTPMVGVFDTAFHQTMPKEAFIYGLPYEAYTDNMVRRYGFHGTSHNYVTLRAIEMLGKPAEETKSSPATSATVRQFPQLRAESASTQAWA